jgi:hypothetical protein
MELPARSQMRTGASWTNARKLAASLWYLCDTRALAGEKPATLPVQQSYHGRADCQSQDGQDFGCLTVSQSLLSRSDEPSFP